MEGYVVVATVADEVSAELAQAALAAAGIEAYLRREDVGGMLPALQQSRGIKVLVDAAHADEARTILSSPAQSQE